MPLAILTFSEKTEKRQSMTVLGKLKPGPSLSSFTAPSKPLSNAGWKVVRAAARPREAGGNPTLLQSLEPQPGRSLPEQGTRLYTVVPHGPAVVQQPDTEVGCHVLEEQHSRDMSHSKDQSQFAKQRTSLEISG